MYAPGNHEMLPPSLCGRFAISVSLAPPSNSGSCPSQVQLSLRSSGLVRPSLSSQPAHLVLSGSQRARPTSCCWE